MSEKKDSKKVMTMLERMGMVRKVDEADDFLEDEALDMSSQPSQSSNETAPVRVPESFWEDSAVQTKEAISFETAPEYVPSYTSPALEYEAYTPTQPDYYDVPATDVPQPAPVETYTDSLLSIDALYGAFSMPTSGTNTVYLIEEYIRSLPDSLPAESRRTIIMKILGASGFDFDALLGDGIDRVNRLNDYASQFAQRTDDYVAGCNGELAELEAKMNQIRSQIEKRKALHKEQFLAIETEAQRIKGILDFITK